MESADDVHVQLKAECSGCIYVLFVSIFICVNYEFVLVNPRVPLWCGLSCKGAFLYFTLGFLLRVHVKLPSKVLHKISIDFCVNFMHDF